MTLKNKEPIPSQPGFNPEWAKVWLERRGWRRDVAGERDFASAIDAMCALMADRSKSLLIRGKAGVGKTMLADIVRIACQRCPTRKIDCGINSDVDDLVSEADASQNGGVYSSSAGDLLDMMVMLDDIGAETVIKQYGNEFNRVGKFITRYYERGKCRLLMTTNLTMNELLDKYGSRVMDRILDMSVVLQLNGESKRDRDIYGGQPYNC